MAKKQVKINVNVRELKNLEYGQEFRTVSNNGTVSSKVYTKEGYNRKTKSYDIGNTRKNFKGTQKVTTDFSKECF